MFDYYVADISDRLGDVFEFALSEGNISGVGAIILNGYSTVPLAGHLTFITSSEILDGLRDGMRRFIYLPDYDREIGYPCSIADPERVICDYLMYPDRLHGYRDFWDLLEGYEEDHKDFSKVYEMMDLFHLDRKLLDEKIAVLGTFATE